MTDEQQVLDVIHGIENLGFNFQQFDANGDNVISPDELEIVAFENTVDAGGKNRHGPRDGCVTLQRSTLRVCVNPSSSRNGVKSS
jgi:hypothetical protein